MAEKKVVELEVNTNLGNLKQQFKQAQQDVQTLADKFGATSIQAVEAAKKAAILKDKINDAKNLTAAFNPDAKFNALSGSLTGVAGGFSVVTGAMAAFGKQNEDVQKALLKVQAAMAIASGLQAVGQSIDQFKQLGAVIKSTTIFQKLYNFVQTGSIAATTQATTAKVADAQATVAQGTATVATTAATTGASVAMKVLRAAFISTGVGALIAGLGMLIANLDTIIEFFSGAAASNKKFSEATKKSTIELNNQVKANEKASTALKTKNTHEYNMAKASGASANALHKLAIRHANEEIALERASLATAKNTLIKEKNTLAYLRNVDASDDVIKKQADLVKKANENSIKENADLQKALQNKAQLIRDNEVRLVEEKTKGSEKQHKTESKSNERSSTNSKAAGKEKIDITKQTEDERIRLMEDGQAKEEAALLLSYKRKKDEEDKQLKEKTLKQADYDTLQKLAAESQAADLLAIKEKYQQKDLDSFTSATFKEQKLLDEDYAKKVLALEGNELLLLQLQKEYDKKTDELELAKQQKIASEKQRLNELTKTEDELKLIKLKADYEAEQKLYKDNAEILLALKKKYDKDVIETTEETTAKQKELDRAVTEKKIQMTMDGLSIINDLFEMNAGKSEKDARKAFKAQKAFNLASALTNTFLAVTAALANKKELFPGQRFVEAGLAGAAGAVQVSKIARTQFEGGTSADTNVPSAPTMSAPQFNVVGQSGINQLASLNQQPVQAYVVSGQVTSQQALDRNRLENATLGG